MIYFFKIMFINCDKERSSLSASFLNSCNKSASNVMLTDSFNGFVFSFSILYIIINILYNIDKHDKIV